MTHTNLLIAAFNPSTVQVTKKTPTSNNLSPILVSVITIKFAPTLLRPLPSYVDSFLKLKTAMKMFEITILNIFNKTLDL